MGIPLEWIRSGARIISCNYIGLMVEWHKTKSRAGSHIGFLEGPCAGIPWPLPGSLFALPEQHRRWVLYTGQMQSPRHLPTPKFILKLWKRHIPNPWLTPAMHRPSLPERKEKPMDEREKRIRLWFHMWLQQQDLGIEHLFTEDVTYIESWGPKYESRTAVKHWFQEWNSRGKVLVWHIQQFFHKEDQTIVEWYFKDEMKDRHSEEFDGMSLIVWTADNRIKYLKEFGCNLQNYNPYQYGDPPQFREEKTWF